MVRLYVNVSLVVSMMIASDHSAGWELYRLGTRGSAYERGLQHGRAFREQIHRDFEDEEGWGHKIPVLHRKPEILAGFMKRLRALPHGQELIEEMQGIAEAARMPFADIAAKNLTIGLGRAHGACSTAILPSTEDGPILINTLDGFPNSRHRRTYPCMVQVAYPTVGQPMAFLGNVGTVWAHRGMNASGLAMGACSGGIGAPRGGINYEGMYYALLSRYALQFHRTANETIELFTANRQLSKGINVSVLDATGDGAIMEYSAFAVGVRRAQNGAPLYATNFFQTDRYPPYSPAHEKLPYMVNARARYRRFAHLLSSTGELDLDFAQGLVHDTNDGKEGQICQDNTTMYTTSAGVYHCRGRTAYAYLTKPTHCEPWVIKLDPVERSASGPSAPANDEVRAVMEAKPLTLKRSHAKLRGATTADVDQTTETLTLKTARGDHRVSMTDGNFRLYVPCTLRDIPSDSAAFLWGRAAEDGASFEATRIVTDRPPVPFQHGRVISREASGLLGQEDGKLTLLYDRQKPACPVTLAPNCELFVSHRTDVTAVRNNMLVDLHGHTLYAGGPVSLTWLIMYVSSEQELPSPKRQSRGLTWRWTA